MSEQQLDTVAYAAATPDLEQPWKELGLKEDEYLRIREILGRRPTDAELAMYSIMWSEHCSYKSSKVHLGYFGETMTDEMRQNLLAGIGENAGVVSIGDDWAVTFKVESHNHPSYVEPYQGAATGVGGIVRDIMAMGARPVAVMDQLRFGPSDATDTKRVLPGVVAGVGGYGNCLGLPNIGGETVFDDTYAGNPLVNALCVGTMRVDDLHLAFASGKGNKVILFGSSTGLDGIGGVSVLASETFDDTPDETGAKPHKKLPSVQVGDPFAEKVLIECCLDLYHAGVVVGIQDLGGAGLSCATSELAAAGDGGMHVDLDKVPMRAKGMTPAEVLSSESQERMCAVVTPENVDAFMNICKKWDVQATVIGEVTDGDHLVIDWYGETVVDAVAHTIAHEGPVYNRPIEYPEWQDSLKADTTAHLARPAGAEELRDTLYQMLACEDLCSRRFVVEQYDRYVRGNTIEAENADAGVLRIDENTGRGIALATDASGRYTYLDPYAGAQLAFAEAYRNVAATGARPVAVTNCLNFGNPEEPAIMWQFKEAVHGLADACAYCSVPVTGGNVSFYNKTGDTSILPTPLAGVLGVIDNVDDATGTAFGSAPMESIFLLGETKDEFDGSIWAKTVHQHLGGVPPQVDLAHEKKLAEFMVEAAKAGTVSAAHDLSEGGLAQAVVESALNGNVGVTITLPEGSDPFVQLFSESAGRILVAVPRDQEAAFTAQVEKYGLPCTRIGVVEESATVTVQGQFAEKLEDLRQAWEGTLPALFARA